MGFIQNPFGFLTLLLSGFSSCITAYRAMNPTDIHASFYGWCGFASGALAIICASILFIVYLINKKSEEEIQKIKYPIIYQYIQEMKFLAEKESGTTESFSNGYFSSWLNELHGALLCSFGKEIADKIYMDIYNQCKGERLSIEHPPINVKEHFEKGASYLADLPTYLSPSKLKKDFDSEDLYKFKRCLIPYGAKDIFSSDGIKLGNKKFGSDRFE